MVTCVASGRKVGDVGRTRSIIVVKKAKVSVITGRRRSKIMAKGNRNNAVG